MPEPEDRDRRDEGDGRSNLARGYQASAPYIAASTQLVGAVGVFAFLGWLVDKKLGHETPWVLVIGAVLGMVGGFISFFKTVLGKKVS